MAIESLSSIIGAFTAICPYKKGNIYLDKQNLRDMPFNWFGKKKDEVPAAGPDYSDVDSLAKAVDLYNKKELGKIFCMPLEFGGEDAPQNTLYVPAHVAVFKMRFDAMVEKLLHEGKKIGYSVNPEYKGASFIPSKVIITVKGEVQMTETIEAW